jgi:hypothetical protein
LKGTEYQGHNKINFPQTTLKRIEWKSPFPLIRHHFGLPDFDATNRGIQHIAESGVLDVIYLGIDQEAQENFFHPERQDLRRQGAGGVPVRSIEDYRTLYESSRRGNFPLLRTYTGTDDFARLAEVFVETIHNAWAAIPLYWFNQMDGRGPWDLEGSIREHQDLMAWYGKRLIPVEVNEPHHWGMRDAPDVIFVVAAYLSAHNARAFGVKDYIVQMMFNSPSGLTDAMDLAKMLAVLKIIEPLAGPDFHIWRQTRTGLLSYPLDLNAARAHLAANVYLQMALRPHILHVVSFTEADHAATAADVIESCKMAQRSIENALGGPDMTQDDRVQTRVDELTREAKFTLEAIRSLAPQEIADPLVNTSTLTQTGQIVVLNPGRTLGAIEFTRVLDENGCANGVTVAETQTFIYASRSDGPTQARIFRIKDAVPLAALPATETPRVLANLAFAYPQFIDGDDVLQTGINNIGAIFHPTISIFNAGWIEATSGDFQFYLDGVTPTVTRLMEVMDRERVTVASAIGVRAVTAREWLKIAYNADGENLYEAIHNQPGYRGINAPPTLSHRYLTEDIPMSLVPIASLGNH